jgi:hypothetical protein
MPSHVGRRRQYLRHVTTLLDLNAILADMRPIVGRLLRDNVAIVLDLRPGLQLVRADRG